jgi:hypothetical protein
MRLLTRDFQLMPKRRIHHRITVTSDANKASVRLRITGVKSESDAQLGASVAEGRRGQSGQVVVKACDGYRCRSRPLYDAHRLIAR